MRIDRDAVENEIDELYERKSALETRLAKLCELRKMLDRADELSKENGGRPVTVEILPQWAIAGPQFVFGKN